MLDGLMGSWCLKCVELIASSPLERDILSWWSVSSCAIGYSGLIELFLVPASGPRLLV